MTSSDQDEIMNKINSLKTDYYSENKKNLIFKNNQKFDCANTIVQNINKTELFNHIFCMNENQLLFNYALFKTIIHPDIYIDFIYHIFNVNEQILASHTTYDVIIDFKGLTMTGVERYKGFVTMLSLEGQKNKKNFLQKLGQVQIKNPPFMIANIGKVLLPLMDTIVKDRIVII
jgi:hypothetical protein